MVCNDGGKKPLAKTAPIRNWKFSDKRSFVLLFKFSAGRQF